MTMAEWRPPARTFESSTQLELDVCMACGQLCELTGSFTMPGLQGPERYVRTRCISGHLLVGPEFALRAAC